MFADNKLIKAQAEEKINLLEAKMSAYASAVKNIDEILNNATSALSNLDLIYESGDVAYKREIIGSIFAKKKLVFEDGQYRTTNVNEDAQLIYQIDK